MPANQHSNPAAQARRFQQGHEDGFAWFFHELYPALCFFAHRLVADAEAAKDIASGAFVKTWAKHQKLATAKDIRAYLYRVARNDCYKWLHHKKRTAALHNELSQVAAAAEQSHLHLIIESEFLARLHRHLGTLPPQQRKVFASLYMEGKTVSETAAALGLHISTVKTQKQRGLLALRKKLSFD